MKFMMCVIFECGDIGHKRLACPPKEQQEGEANTGAIRRHSLSTLR